MAVLTDRPTLTFSFGLSRLDSTFFIAAIIVNTVVFARDFCLPAAVFYLTLSAGYFIIVNMRGILKGNQDEKVNNTDNSGNNGGLRAI